MLDQVGHFPVGAFGDLRFERIEEGVQCCSTCFERLFESRPS